MLYLNEDHLQEIGIRWPELVDCIENAVRAIDNGQYAQPLKPYLRYREPRNRIIAMPAFVGGGTEAAGLKWIASFPGNVERGLPRAHSVTLLNDPDTGVPYAMLNTPLASTVRTAAVSGLLLRQFMAALENGRSTGFAAPKLRIGIIGWGPIGRLHFDMCNALFGERIDRFVVYDIRGSYGASFDAARRDSADGDSHRGAAHAPQIADNWHELYDACDVIITCTASDHRYIDRPPAEGKLLLHVSLRDYMPEALRRIAAIVVDDWREVCRENTDIECLAQTYGLVESDTLTLADVVCRDSLLQLPPDTTVLFCPMGMAVFDIAVAQWFFRQGRDRGVGIRLP